MDIREFNRQKYAKEVNDNDDEEETVTGPAKNESKMAEEIKLSKSRENYSEYIQTFKSLITWYSRLGILGSKYEIGWSGKKKKNEEA